MSEYSNQIAQTHAASYAAHARAGMIGGHGEQRLPEPARTPEIPMLLDRLMQRTEELGKLFSVTEARLSPVMGADVPAAGLGAERARAVSNSTTGGVLREVDERLDAVINRWHAILQRLEL